MEFGEKISDEQLVHARKNSDFLSFLETTSEFDDHWIVNQLEHIPKSKIDKANSFLKPLFSFVVDKTNCDILDAGCGDGMHAFALSEKGTTKAHNYYGVDISEEALHLTKQRLTEGKYRLINCDIGNLPFKNNSFDVVFSYGVLAYTQNPKKSFSELVRILKPGGLVGVWLYPRSKGINFLLFNTIRNICRIAGRRSTILIANCIVPFLGFLPTSSRLNLSNASWKQCREIVLVNIAPRYLEFFTPEDIERWFQEQEILVTHNDKKEAITFWGLKKASP